MFSTFAQCLSFASFHISIKRIIITLSHFSFSCCELSSHYGRRLAFRNGVCSGAFGLVDRLNRARRAERRALREEAGRCACSRDRVRWKREGELSVSQFIVTSTEHGAAPWPAQTAQNSKIVKSIHYLGFPGGPPPEY